MVKLPLWLNTDTGLVIGANSRPNGFVKVVLVEVNGETIHSTIDALYKLISFDSPRHNIALTDLEIKDTSIKSYGSPDDNKWWEQTLGDFPYINLSMDEHTILTITYKQIQADANGTQATTGDTEDEDEESLPGGRGGGGGGGDPITPPDKTPITPPDKTPPKTPPEEKDPYEDGKRKGDKLDDDKRSKMQELMDKVKGGEGGEPTTGGEGQEQGDGDSGEPTEAGEGQGEGGSGQGDGQGDGDSDEQGDGQDTDSEEGGADGAGQGKGDGDGQGPDGNCDNCGGDDHDSDDCDLPPQGDSGNIWEQAVALAKEHLEETKKAKYEGRKDDANQNAYSTEMDAKFIKALADAIANDDWEKVAHYMKNLALIGDMRGVSVDDVKKMVEIPDAQPYIDKAQEYADEARRIADGGEFEYDEGLDPLEQAVKDAEDAKDEAKEAAKRADADEAQEAADKSQEAADEATEIAEQVGDEEAEEMAEKAQDAADEAQEAADAAKELEEMIKEMFEEEENLDEEDFEEFKEGVLDSLNEEENNGVAVIMNFDGQYPTKIVMEDGTLTTSVSKYVNEHIKYGFVPSGFSIGYKGYVRADGKNKGMIQFYNEDDKNKAGRSDWYITLIPSNVDIIGDDSPTPQDLDKSGREGVYTSSYGNKKRKGRKYVNWETGEIRLFIPEDKIGPNWLEVTKFFSGVYDGGSEIVVDRTIDGAAKLVNLLGGNTKNQTATSFTIVNGDSQITNLLNKMRMFMISGNEVSY